MVRISGFDSVLQFWSLKVLDRSKRILYYLWTKRYVSDAYNPFGREEWHIEKCVIAYGDAAFIRSSFIRNDAKTLLD